MSVNNRNFHAGASVLPVTLDLLVAVALAPALLTSWHRCIALMGIGPSGAEGLAAAHLTSSLDNSMLNAPMPDSDPSVKLVLLSFSHLAQYSTSNFTDAQVSVHPRPIS